MENGKWKMEKFMSAIVRKEIRMLLPAWIGAMAICILPVLVPALFLSKRDLSLEVPFAITMFAQIAFAGSALVLGLIPFGLEFANRTFSQLLAQPTGRIQLWRTKVTTATAALVVTLVAMLVALALMEWFYEGSVILVTGMSSWFAVVGVAAFCGGLWTTLTFRSIPIAFCATILIPFVLVAIITSFTPRNEPTTARYVLCIYSAAGFLFARWYFLRAQDVNRLEAPVVLHSKHSGFFTLIPSFSRQRSAWRALVRKESQFQQLAIVIGCLIFLLHGISIAVRPFLRVDPNSVVSIIVNNFWFLWLTIPLLVGTCAIAEERRLRTYESLLTLPISRRWIFFTKLGQAIAWSIFFGSTCPMLLEKAAGIFGIHTTFNQSDLASGMVGASLIIGCVAFFCSCVSRSPIECLCMSLLALLIGGCILQMFSTFGSAIGRATRATPLYGPQTPYIFGVALGTALLWTTWRNFQRVQISPRDMARTWLTVAGATALAWTSSSVVFYRTWEKFVPLEPKHGAAMWHVGDRVKIFSGECGPLALLPDGRIWRAEYIEHFSSHVISVLHTNPIFAVGSLQMVNPPFVPGTNWVDLAVARAGYAIKSDGTLWEVNPSLGTTNGKTIRWHSSEPKQVGIETNWSQIVAGARNQFLALKRDGSLWGWGENWWRELGAGPGHIDKPKPVWPADRWTKVFICGSICFGFKTNGTGWRWGYMADTEIVAAGLRTSYPTPSPSPFPGTNWTGFYGTSTFELGLKNDGTLWYVAPPAGYNWEHTLLGERLFNTTTPRLFTNDPEWRAITACPPLSVIKNSGEWRLAAGHWIGRFPEENIRVSGYTDWLAVSAEHALIGIAADGTISCWMEVEDNLNVVRSHRPTWSANVFATR